MFEDADFWLVLLSLGVTAAALGTWINKAGDDWLHSQLDPPNERDNPGSEATQEPRA